MGISSKLSVFAMEMLHGTKRTVESKWEMHSFKRNK